MRLRDDRGSAAAEFAVVLPVAVLLFAAGAGVMQAQAQRVLVQDVTADAARLISRGEDVSRAAAAVTSAVPGAAVEFRNDGDVVCATGTSSVRVFGAFAVDVTATSCALDGGL